MVKKLPKPRLKIGIVMDFDEKLGFFLKADLHSRFLSLNVELIPITYDEKRIKSFVKAIDGLVLPGGVLDLDPELYGEQQKFKEVKILKARSHFEFKLLDTYLLTQKPLLCICWGLQSLNVYFGGRLYQHLPVQLKNSGILHEQAEEGSIATHRVNFQKGATKLLKRKQMKVNSTHHQGIKTLGRGLSDQGKADDGIVEICSIKGHSFGWAVQWHPERLKADPVIPAFLAACRRSRS